MPWSTPGACRRTRSRRCSRRTSNTSGGTATLRRLRVFVESMWPRTWCPRVKVFPFELIRGWQMTPCSAGNAPLPSWSSSAAIGEASASCSSQPPCRLRELRSSLPPFWTHPPAGHCEYAKKFSLSARCCMAVEHRRLYAGRLAALAGAPSCALGTRFLSRIRVRTDNAGC